MDPGRLCRRGVVEAADEGGLRLAIDGPVSATSSSCDSAAVCCGQCPGVRSPARIDWRHLSEYATRAGAGPGDTVELSVAAAGLTRVAFWLFGMPLAGLVTGALVGRWLGGGAPSAVGMAGGLGMLGLVAGVLTALRLAPRLIGMLQIRASIDADTAAFHKNSVASASGRAVTEGEAALPGGFSPRAR